MQIALKYHFNNGTTAAMQPTSIDDFHSVGEGSDFLTLFITGLRNNAEIVIGTDDGKEVVQHYNNVVSFSIDVIR